MHYPIILISFCLLISSISGGTISNTLKDLFTNNPDKIVNLILELPSVDESIPPILGGGDIGEELRNSLRELTSLSQGTIIDAIKKIDPNSVIQNFWIVNRIGVIGVSGAIANKIANIPGDFRLRLEEVAQLHSVGDATVLAANEAQAVGQQPQWGIKKINAQTVWNITKGIGVVVANIDTGVRLTHEALFSNHRSEYGWLDGFKNSSTDPPNDGNGHGTHTMGTICGQKGVGVAPDAQWIACKGCNSDGCPETALLTCGQWTFCPYTANASGAGAVADCSKRPKIVSNSWGGLGGSTFFNAVIQKWKTVGIIPVFAIGNNGPACSTTGSPGNQNDVIGVGSTTDTDDLSSFSSRGPYASTSGSKIKPDIAAPGTNITSAWYTGNTDYATYNGTSMATPHVAGAIALLLSRNPSLTYNKIYQTITNNAFKKSLTLLDSTTTCSCVGTVCGLLTPSYPNNGYGSGRLDVLASFKALGS